MKEKTKKNIFFGNNAGLEFVNPENFITPIVEVHNTINPFQKDGVRFFAKMLQFSPLAQVKSIPSYEMLLQAQINGSLKGKDTIVEASSGNTSYGLSVIGRFMSIKNFEAYVSNEISPKKLNLLRLFDIKPQVFTDPLCADATDPESRIYKAKDAGKKHNMYNPGQYSNTDNPNAHYKYTARQIWDQMGGQIDVFVCGLGTSGTFSGCSSFLKGKKQSIKCVAGLRSENNMVPGLRTKNQMAEINFPWKKFMDQSVKIGSTDSYKNSLDLIRYGIIAGPSSGLSFAAAKSYIQNIKDVGELDSIRNDKGQVNVVFICCDFPYLYLDEYFDYLDDSYFPKIENENLLINKPDTKYKKKEVVTSNLPEITAENAYRLLYQLSKKELWKIVNEEKEVQTNKNILIIDVRTDQEFQHFHLPGSKHIELQKLSKQISKLKKESKGKKVIFVCKTGNRSGIATQIAITKNIDALNLVGGVTEWSRLNLPRIRPKICVNI